MVFQQSSVQSQHVLETGDFLQKYENLLVGSPEFVAERIDKFRSELNCQHVTLWPNPGFVPFEKVLKALHRRNL